MWTNLGTSRRPLRSSRALAAAAVAAAALVAAGAAQSHSHAPAANVPLLGITEDRAPFDTLVRLDRTRVLPVRHARRVDLGYSSYSWSFSPDLTRIVFGRYGDHEAEDTEHAPSFLRIVDPSVMRVTSEVPLGRGVLRGAPAWLAPDRIAAAKVDCCSDAAEVVVADPTQSRVVARRPLPYGSPLAVASAGGRFAVLAATGVGFGPVELVVVDADGAIRSGVMERISGGDTETGDPAQPDVDELRPALALSRDGRRAYVISSGGLAAEVDLASFAVTYHELPLPSPPAANKRVLGRYRCAQVLPTGSIALTGYDVRLAVDREGIEVMRRMTAGLRLVDPGTWTVRAVDRHADSARLAGGRLLATGWRLNTKTDVARGTGLTAYTLQGKRVFRLFLRKWVSLWEAYGPRAYVLAEGHRTLSVVSIRKGRIVGERRSKTFPRLVAP
jgi:hypothetical protein